MTAELAPLCDGEVVLYSADSTLAALAEHRANGGRAVFSEGNSLILVSPAEVTQLVPLSEVPFVAGDQSGTRLEIVLAAVAAAWALGIAHHIIRTGLETFSLDPADSTHLQALGQPDSP
jgi:cyanophycin synthetase